MEGLTRNIRYLLWKGGVERNEWHARLAGWLSCPLPRAEELLEGKDEEVTLKEKKTLAKATGISPDDLSADLLERQGVNILVENIRHLLNDLPHGQKKEFAASLGVDVTTVSRWLGGAQRPTKTKLGEIGKFFGLPPGTDLDSEPIFLWTEPISGIQMKKWISEKIEEADEGTLRAIFPALKRLLRK